MSDNSLRPDPKPGGGKPLDKLKAALIDYREAEERALSVKTSACIPLLRLRELALDAGLTNAFEAEHFGECRRCTVILQGIQSEFETEPRALFEAAAGASQNVLLQTTFHRLYGHGGEPERAHTLMRHAHDLARALRHYHCTGTHVEVASFIAAMGFAIRTAVKDPLTPWARCFDYGWPLQVMLVDAAAEAAHGSISDRSVAEVYASVVRDAPGPLKAILIYGLGGLSRRGSYFRHMAIDIASRIADSGPRETREILAMLVQTNALHVGHGERWNAIVDDAQPVIAPLLSAVDGELHKLHRALLEDAGSQAIASKIHESIIGAAEGLFQERDAFTATLRLLAVRYYIARVTEQTQYVSPQFFGATFGNVVPVLVRRALRKRGRLYLAIELVAQAGPLPAVVQAMAKLLEHEDPTLRQALFVYFVDALTYHNETGATPRFAGEGAEWIFEGGASHPLRIFGEHAARLARHDDALRSLLEWSNTRLEGLLCEGVLEETAGV